ncbi:outer membrane beta-barrel protein [Sphingobacterium sp. Mn56C]|uniref:outer membrane beta-barrel protein n=1 Tax=Sphingobacterium sp. Mn56C TaxID=3395261 RepID=UPI003BC0FF96
MLNRFRGNVKVLSFLFGILVLPFAVQAQHWGGGYGQRRGPVFHLGVMGGATLARATGNERGNERLWGWLVGPYASLDFTENLGLQAEVLYSRNRVWVDNGNEGAQSKIGVKSWDFPLLLRYSVADFFTLQAGPQIRRNVTSERNRELNNQHIQVRHQVSYVIGFELGSKQRGKRVFGRYNWNNKYDNTAVDKTVKINQFQFGVLFPLL